MGAAAAATAAASAAATAAAAAEEAHAAAELAADLDRNLELATAEAPAAIEIAPPEIPAEPPPRSRRKSVAPPAQETAKPRTKTADRGSTRSSQFRSMPPPPPPEEDAPTLLNSDIGAIAAAINAQSATTVPTAVPPPTPPPAVARTATPPPTPPPRVQPPATRASPPPIPQRGGSRPAIPLVPVDSSPEIQILRDDDHSGRNRAPRDTAVNEQPFDGGGIPAMVGDDATRPSDGIPPMPRTGADSIPPLPPAPDRHSPSRPPPSHGAATLPPMARPPSRPAMTPPTVMSRPLTNDTRGRDSDAVEVYAPAPPSTEPPPGERAERPGQYSVSRRKEQPLPSDVPMREHTGRIAIPSGLGRPRPPNQSQPTQRTAAPSTPPLVPERGVPQPIRTEPTPSAGAEARARAPSTSSDGVPRTRSPSTSSDGVPQPDSRPNTSSTRTPHLTAPMASRTPTGSPHRAAPCRVRATS